MRGTTTVHSVANHRVGVGGIANRYVDFAAVDRRVTVFTTALVS